MQGNSCKQKSLEIQTRSEGEILYAEGSGVLKLAAQESFGWPISGSLEGQDALNNLIWEVASLLKQGGLDLGDFKVSSNPNNSMTAEKVFEHITVELPYTSSWAPDGLQLLLLDSGLWQHIMCHICCLWFPEVWGALIPPFMLFPKYMIQKGLLGIWRSFICMYLPHSF